MAQLSWCGQMVGRLVHVQKGIADLDWSAVSASIDCDPYFSRDGHDRHKKCGVSAWHAVRIHNFCRPMGSPEACCERVGSTMHSLWDPHRGARGGTGLLMDEVVLQEAKVEAVGSARDEGLIEEIASALWQTVYRLLITQRKRHRERSQGCGRQVTPTGLGPLALQIQTGRRGVTVMASGWERLSGFPGLEWPPLWMKGNEPTLLHTLGGT